MPQTNGPDQLRAVMVGWLGADEDRLPVHALVIRPGGALLRWSIADGRRLVL
jgi:hypothetical protein